MCRRGCRNWRRAEFLLGHLRSGLLDLDGRSLELETRNRTGWRAGRSVLGLRVELALLGGGVGVNRGSGIEG